MGIEIERKFLVTDDDWRKSEPTYYCQGYLCTDKERTVRVRIAGDKARVLMSAAATNVNFKVLRMEPTLDETDSRPAAHQFRGPRSYAASRMTRRKPSDTLLTRSGAGGTA